MRSRWAVFISGSGSNAHAVLESLSDWDISLVVSSRRKAAGCLRARRFGVETLTLEPMPDWGRLTAELRQRKISRIFLLGFMKILPPVFCQQWQGQIWNLHPSLLPEFKGANAIELSYEAGKKMGVTIHEVTSEMDAGPVVLQKKITDQARGDFANLDSAQRAVARAEQGQVRKWMKHQQFLRDSG